MVALATVFINGQSFTLSSAHFSYPRPPVLMCSHFHVTFVDLLHFTASYFIAPTPAPQELIHIENNIRILAIDKFLAFSFHPFGYMECLKLGASLHKP